MSLGLFKVSNKNFVVHDQMNPAFERLFRAALQTIGRKEQADDEPIETLRVQLVADRSTISSLGLRGDTGNNR
jgi:hypothetical protein